MALPPNARAGRLDGTAVGARRRRPAAHTYARELCSLARLAGLRSSAIADAGEDDPAVYVYPGEMLCTAQPVIATTILGTCVSVCLFDAARSIGGLNHFMLPHAPPTTQSTLRFGNLATRRLVEALCAFGAERARLRAKVFGGMVDGRSPTASRRDLGARNVEAALTSLHELDIPVVDQNVGGPSGLRLVFRSWDGRTWVRHF